MRRARSRVRLVGHFDGETVATVTITAGPEPLLEVRPYRRRRTFALRLADVARDVIFQVVAAEVRANGPRSRGRR